MNRPEFSVFSNENRKPMICGSWVANRPMLSTFSGIQQQKPQLRILQFNKPLMYMLYYIVLYSTILYHIILYYILYYCILYYILYYIIHVILYIIYQILYIKNFILYIKYIYICTYTYQHWVCFTSNHWIGFGWNTGKNTMGFLGKIDGFQPWKPLEDFLKIDSMVPLNQSNDQIGSCNYYEL